MFIQLLSQSWQISRICVIQNSQSSFSIIIVICLFCPWICISVCEITDFDFDFHLLSNWSRRVFSVHNSLSDSFIKFSVFSASPHLETANGGDLIEWDHEWEPRSSSFQNSIQIYSIGWDDQWEPLCSHWWYRSCSLPAFVLCCSIWSFDR